MIIILTALPCETQAVRRHLDGVEVHRHRAGTVFEVGGLARRPDRRIALGTTGMGNLSAAALTERAITEFSPSAVLFVGVAGGLQPWLRLGDVVFGTKVHAFHGGRSTPEGFFARPNTWSASHALEQEALHLHRTDGWLPARDRAPGVYFAPIAAGEVVIDSLESPELVRLRQNYNDAVAIEMEGAGCAQAGHLNSTTQVAAIRGISDHADGRKEEVDGQGWQEVAAANAAAFAVALAAGFPADEQDQGSRRPPQPDPPAVHNTNSATGNARVGQQIGVIHGGFTVENRGDR